MATYQRRTPNETNLSEAKENSISTMPVMKKAPSASVQRKRKVLVLTIISSLFILLLCVITKKSNNSSKDTGNTSTRSIEMSSTQIKDEQGSSSSSSSTTTTENKSPLITSGVTKGGEHQADIAYYHCGTTYTSSDKSVGIEILLLHGAAFTKENWRESEILDKICSVYATTVSVVAADLPVSSDGKGLYDLFTSLTKDNIISGQPLTLVTPSASGRSVISLAEYASTSSTTDTDEQNYLTSIIKNWIPVASFSVVKAAEQYILEFPKRGIQILAMHGDQDEKGKLVTQRLVESAYAERSEIPGRHPCYLDSPDEFVRILMEYVQRKHTSL